MIKINSKEYNLEEDDYLIRSLIEKGDLIKRGDGYFWTEKSIRKTIKSSIRLIRSINSPLWRFYYSFFDW